MYKFPVGIPQEANVILTQGFRSTELAEWYKSRGLNYPVHTAIDIITSLDPVKTHGTPIICPFANGANIVDASEARLQVSVVKQGAEEILGFLHLSSVVAKPFYKYGEVMGYIGNIGYVKPEPSIGRPFDGSHLHMTFVRGGEIVDPLQYFDIGNPFRVSDSGVSADLPALMRAAEWIRIKLRSMGVQPVAGAQRRIQRCTQ